MLGNFGNIAVGSNLLFLVQSQSVWSCRQRCLPPMEIGHCQAVFKGEDKKQLVFFFK